MATNLSNQIWWEKSAKNPADLHIFLTEITTQTVNCRLKDLGLYIFVRDFRKGLITGIEKKHFETSFISVVVVVFFFWGGGAFTGLLSILKTCL